MKRLTALVIPLVLILGLPVTAQATTADLSISVAGPSTVDQGTDALYTVTYANTGGDAATNVTLSVKLPTGLTVDPLLSWGGCTPATLFVAMVCDIGTVPAGASASHTIAVSGNTLGTYSIPFKMTSEPPNSTNADNTAKETLQVVPATHADLSIEIDNKNIAPRATEAATIITTFAASGPVEATGVVITFQLAPGLQYQADGSDSRCSASGQTVACAIGDFGLGGGLIEINVSAATAGSYPIAASIQGDQPDQNPANNVDRFAIPYQPPEAFLGLQFTGTIVRAFAETPVQFDISPFNIGPDDATGVSLQVTFPDGWTVAPSVTDPRCSSASPGVLSCALGVLAAGTGTTLVVAGIPPAAGTFNVTATVSADQQGQSAQASEKVTVTAPIADLSVAIATNAAVTQNQPFQYSAIVANNGPATQGVVITNSFSTNVGIVIQGITFPDGTCTQSDNVVTCTVAFLIPPGEVRVDISLVATGTGTIDETSTATPIAQDPNPANNTATYSTVVS